MKLIGRDKLICLQGTGASIEVWLKGWSSEILTAHWHHINDVLQQFPKATLNKEGCFEFSVGNGTNWVICAQIVFSRHVVIVKDVKG